MDPATLATTTVAFLAPYLVKAGEKSFEKIGETLPEAVGKLWQSIAAKFRNQPSGEAAVKDLMSRPADQLSQAGFTSQLRNAIEADPEFAAEMERLLKSAKSQGGDTITNTGTGAVATRGGIAAGEGGIAVQGDVSGGINLGRPRPRE